MITSLSSPLFIQTSLTGMPCVIIAVHYCHITYSCAVVHHHNRLLISALVPHLQVFIGSNFSQQLVCSWGGYKPVCALLGHSRTSAISTKRKAKKGKKGDQNMSEACQLLNPYSCVEAHHHYHQHHDLTLYFPMLTRLPLFHPPHLQAVFNAEVMVSNWWKEAVLVHLYRAMSRPPGNRIEILGANGNCV